MKRSNKLWRMLLLGVCLILLITGCRKKLAPLTLTYEPYADDILTGYLVSAASDDTIQISRLLFSATDGALIPAPENIPAPSEDGAGAITVTYGVPVVWCPDDDRQSTVRLTVTAFDEIGRELTSQEMTFALSADSWQVTEEQNVQPAP